MKDEDYLSVGERRRIKNEWLDRRTFRFMEFIAKWFPVALMLSHWYGVWDYGHHPRPIFIDTKDNGACIIWLYVVSYIATPVLMLPVSYFFHFCWMYRIPFLYLFGINAIRLYYGNWLIRPEQVDAHYVFVLFTIILYVYGFGKIACERSKVCSKNA